jgi:uncharacterized protein
MTILMYTPLYIALNGLVLFALAVSVMRFRFKQDIPMGDGGLPQGLQRMRAMSNFVEYAPLILILLGSYEYLSQNTLAVHICGIALTLGRALHGYGLHKAPGPTVARGAGMLATLGVLLYLIGAIIWYYIEQL